MTPLWVQDILFWLCLIFIGYFTCHFKLEKRFKKELDLKSEKLFKRIDQLQRKNKELREKT